MLLSVVQSASANGDGYQGLCEDGGGTWVGSDAWNGTCTYPPGVFQAESPCNDTQIVQTTIVYFPFSRTFHCINVTSGGEEYSHNSGQSADEPIRLCTQAAGEWRCSYFNEGTCAVNCYIDPHLPAGAQAALPGGVISTLYVNISPDPGGFYSVCFENPDNVSFTIYQYLGGVWVPLMTSTINPVCASASGDGSFYLGS